MPTEPKSATAKQTISDDTAISLEGVSVLYRVPRERITSIKEYAVRWLQRRLEYEDFWALDNVSFQVRRGEVFGIIGRNGSGKSTLLKVIARVLFPQRGRVYIRGRVAPLLELGAGFQFELTGRENIFLNSALLGRTHAETQRLLPEIIDFAEIGEFIDAPVRTYSTGMVARLGFSVATCVQPEILLVDEVLSVGDAQFQQKCLDRMYNYRQNGSTILIVSHGMGTIESFCDRAMWLDCGHVRVAGPVKSVIQRYVQITRGETEPQAAETRGRQTSAIETTPAGGLTGYAPLEKPGSIYAPDSLNLRQGTVSTWVQFKKEYLQRQPYPYLDCVLFHTDDSRYVLYLRLEVNASGQLTGQSIVARAGGNRRILDPFYGNAIFPEAAVSLAIEKGQQGTPVQPGEYHLLSMTWEGKPEGIVRLYLDGVLAGEHAYDERYNDNRSQPRSIAIGIRPPSWAGEIIEEEDGTVYDSRPASDMSVEEGGLEMRDTRLYPRALSQPEILALHHAGPNATTK
ncbi:MAG: ATP-binding cassette domain-containing protein [Anaerolineales bacterium]|nr:ATP-binding cassette domain-containing protein [Anaerolineales bacterium]